MEDPRHHGDEPYVMHEVRSATGNSLGGLLVGIAALLAAFVLIAMALYLMLAPVHATPWDADGVRCYHRATALECIQTARP